VVVTVAITTLSLLVQQVPQTLVAVVVAEMLAHSNTLVVQVLLSLDTQSN
jgi:hypothetical protein